MGFSLSSKSFALKGLPLTSAKSSAAAFSHGPADTPPFYHKPLWQMSPDARAAAQSRLPGNARVGKEKAYQQRRTSRNECRAIRQTVHPLWLTISLWPWRSHLTSFCLSQPYGKIKNRDHSLILMVHSAEFPPSQWFVLFWKKMNVWRMPAEKANWPNIPQVFVSSFPLLQNLWSRRNLNALWIACRKRSFTSYICNHYSH